MRSKPLTLFYAALLTAGMTYQAAADLEVPAGNAGIPETLAPANGDQAGSAAVVAAPVKPDGGLAKSVVAVPEPGTMVAGALLLLPFGVTVVRAMRRNRAR